MTNNYQGNEIPTLAATKSGESETAGKWNRIAWNQYNTPWKQDLPWSWFPNKLRSVSVGNAISYHG